MEDGLSVIWFVEMEQGLSIMSLEEESSKTKAMGWRCATTMPLEELENVTVRPVSSPLAIAPSPFFLPATDCCSCEALLLPKRALANSTLSPSSPTNGTLPSAPPATPNPDADNPRGNCTKSSSSSLTTANDDVEEGVVLMDSTSPCDTDSVTCWLLFVEEEAVVVDVVVAVVAGGVVMGSISAIDSAAIERAAVDDMRCCNCVDIPY
mmetsp:Transcript_24860/g.44730  ORF Transcript_24860/g.44730 Transcript_24860/m.44730 type:complete len:208 (-) Transcript_24860:428-1051(-)